MDQLINLFSIYQFHYEQLERAQNYHIMAVVGKFQRYICCKCWAYICKIFLSGYIKFIPYIFTNKKSNTPSIGLSGLREK